MIFIILPFKNVFAEESLNTTKEVHDKAIELGYVQHVDNKLYVNKDIYNLAEKEIIDLYLQEIESVNNLYEKNLVTITENLSIEPLDTEEVIKVVYKSSSNLEPSDITILSPDHGLPYINLVGLVTANRNEIETVYNDYLALSRLGANINPWALTTGYWIGKVQEGGPWDYKRVSGFSPWYKQWWAYTYSGERQITTEYIGNYNYGYTGEFLFSLNILYLGGQIANGLKFWEPEDQEDRNAIRDGYYDAK